MNLKMERIRRGMTQAELRKLTKLSPNKIVQIEKGNIENVRVRDLQCIAEAIGIPVCQLFPELSILHARTHGE